MPKERITYLSLGFNNFLEQEGMGLFSGPARGAEFYGLEHRKPLQEMGADFAARIPDIAQARDIRRQEDITTVDGASLYSGSVGSEKIVTIIDDQDSNITYSGSWYSMTDYIQYFNRSYHLTFETDSYLEYTFRGMSRIGIFAAKDKLMGKIDVYIDGVLDETVDLYGAVLLTKFSVYTKTGLNPNVEHTIKVVLRSDRNPSATGNNFHFDGFEVGSMLGGTNLYQVQAALSYSGNLNSNGYATATFPVFEGHEFLAIVGVRIVDPSINSSDTREIYTEAGGTGQNSADATWQNLNISSTVPAGAEVAEFYIENADTGAARVCGIRANGSSANRYFDVSSPGADGRNGYTATVALDSDRILEIYSEDYADAYFNLLGYWRRDKLPKIQIERNVVYFYGGQPDGDLDVSVYALFLRS